ncbi:hypothetical protein [Streptomyces sp. NBC_01244]|uniref:hypothetical protein n=1 Tax=Streptomyces sp. NBC_01244 TaxID=2903797 RepID=UPI002E13AA6B|nr:hypothetical protein OG247_43980 [Streptomyces sp. NBC_01244]
MTPAPPGGPLHLTTPTGDRLTVRTETDWRFGLALYHVAEAGGWITISPARNEAGCLLVAYGRPEGYTLDRTGTTWTQRPVFNRQEVRGIATVHIANMEQHLEAPGWSETDTWHYWLTRPRRSAPRATGPDPWERGRLTDRAHQRVASTVAALVRHHTGRPDLTDLHQAAEYAYAPREVRDLEEQRRTALHRIRDDVRTALDLTDRIAQARRTQPAPQQSITPTPPPATGRTPDDFPHPAAPADGPP